MALRASANLTISFGLVNVGVKIQPLYGEDEALECHTYDAASKARIQNKKVRANDGAAVVDTDIIYGYDFNGSVVYMTDAERRALESEKDKRITLTHYVPLDQIDYHYFEKPYVAWPDKGHEQGYDMILAVLRDGDMALVGEVTLSKTTRMLVLRYSEDTGTLLAHLCNYESNVRRDNVETIRDAQEKRPEADPAMVEMARTLFENLEPDFDPNAVSDTYAARVYEAVAAKAKGVKVEQPKDEPTPAAPDLMAAMRAMVEDVKKPKRPAPKAKAAAAKRPATKKAPAKKKARA